jgi:aromatic ring-cleaving dioxygenase
MKSATREQELIDIMFQMVLTTHSHHWFKTATTEEVAEWVRQQLGKNGFNVSPCGLSHGVLSK